MKNETPISTRPAFFHRPHWTRRRFFEILGAGVTGAFLPRKYARAAEVGSYGAAASPKGTAKNVVFIYLNGAPSHTDTFDLKMVANVTRPPSTPRPSTACSSPPA